MSYRWNEPYLGQPDLSQADQAYNAARAQQGMAGYTNPAHQMAGYRPGVAPASPYNNAELAQQNLDQFNLERQQRNQQLQGRISELETELAQIDARLEAINAKLPPDMSDKEISIAATRAAAGDYSAYDNMMNRASTKLQNDKSKVDNMSTELQNARKLVWGLSSKDSDNQKAAFNQVDLALEQYERFADEMGTNPNDNPDYRALKKERDSAASAIASNPNARSTASVFWSKAQDGTLTDADLKEAKRLHDEDPNSTDAELYRKIFTDYKDKTVEAKARSKQAKDNAKKTVDGLMDLGTDAAIRKWNSLTEAERKNIKKFYDVAIGTDKATGGQTFSIKKKD